MKGLHLNVKIIGRSSFSGKGNAVAAAAYRLGVKLVHQAQFNKDTNKTELINSTTYDYTNKGNKGENVLHDFTETLLPKHAPECLKDPGTLWNLVEATERRKDSQLFREFLTDLHNNIDVKTQVEAFKRFAQENFVNEGMICQFAVHKSKRGNYHIHAMLTMREIVPTSERKADLFCFGKKNREWNNQNLVDKWRENWTQELQNVVKQHNENPLKKTHAEQVTFRSFLNEAEIARKNENLSLYAETLVKHQTREKNLSKSFPGALKRGYDNFLKEIDRRNEEKKQKIDEFFQKIKGFVLKNLDKFKQTKDDSLFELLKRYVEDEEYRRKTDEIEQIKKQVDETLKAEEKQKQLENHPFYQKPQYKPKFG